MLLPYSILLLSYYLLLQPLSQETKRDLESKLLRQSNDDSSHYEAASRAVAAQHQRETDCLREELLQERKR